MIITDIRLQRLRIDLDPPFRAAWDPEPRRAPSSRDRERRGDRGDRGGDRGADRGGDRGDRGPRPAFVPPSQMNAPQGGPTGITQAIPEDQPARTSAPILPPMAPPQPSWKDKDKPEAETAKPENGEEGKE